MRLLLIIIILISGSFNIKAQIEGSPIPLTLEECIQYALENNEQLAITKLEKEKSNAQVREIVSNGLPQATFKAGLNHNYKVQTSLIDASNFDPSVPEGTEAKIQFGQPYDGNLTFGIDQLIFDGAYFIGVQAAKTFRELATKEDQRVEIDVIEAVSKAYYTVLINKNELELLDKNFNRLDSLLRETQEMYNNGFAEQIDVDRIRVSFNNVRINKKTYGQLLLISEKLLKFQMGMDLGENIDLTTQLKDVDLSVPELPSKFDYVSRIEYSQLQTNQNLALLDKKNYQSQYLPKLYAGFSYGSNTAAGTGGDLFDGNRWFGYGKLGATVSIPIFDGFYKRSKVQQTQIKFDQISFQKNILEKSIDIEIEQSKIKLEGNLEILEVQEQNVNLASNIYNTTKIKFQEGVGSNNEVTDADNALKEAQVNYSSALYNAIISKIELLKALGKLDKQFQRS